MTKKKKIFLTILLGVLVIFALFGLVLCIKTLIANHIELSSFLQTHTPDFFWCRILRENIILLYIVLVVILINLGFVVLNLIMFIKKKKVKRR